MGEVVRKTGFPSEEQTPKQRAYTDAFLLEIAQTGHCREYGPKIEESDQLATLYLRQQSTPEQDKRWGELSRMLEGLFGIEGVRAVFQVYDFHPVRVEQTMRTIQETAAIMDTLPPICRLPRNQPPTSS